jgi:hypothetical protein
MPRRILRTGVIALILAFVGCSQDTTTPHRGLYLTTIAGANQRDTIGATLAQAVIVQVAGTSDIVGRTVVFEAPTTESSFTGPACLVYLAALSGPPVSCEINVTTDAHGQAVAVIRFAANAGATFVVATALDSTGSRVGSPDTIRFTIDPGNATGITASPGDTAMFVGATLSLHAFTHDRAGNPRSDAVTYGPKSGPVTLSGAQISATATGRAAIVAHSAPYSDTTRVSVVPNGTIAYGLVYNTPNGVAILGLDGSHYRLVPTTSMAVHTSWAPSAAAIVYDDANYGVEVYHQPLVVLDTTGSQRPADTTALDLSANEWGGQYSRDGQWLYFTRYELGSTVSFSQLWRVGANGAATPVPNNAPVWDYAPSPSPDGTTLAYASSSGFGAPATIKLLNIATGVVTNTGVTGDSPRWAPQGQSIAFLNGFTLSVMQADGSKAHAVGPGGNAYVFGIDWSPDGQWLVAVNLNTGHVDVINVASGIALPLAFTSQVDSPTWRPTPQ